MLYEMKKVYMKTYLMSSENYDAIISSSSPKLLLGAQEKES